LISARNTGTADAAEGFGKDFDGDGFARTGRAGNQAVAVGHLRQQEYVLIVGFADEQFAVEIHNSASQTRCKIR
jgi:hypothetical protein